MKRCPTTSLERIQAKQCKWDIAQSTRKCSRKSMGSFRSHAIHWKVEGTVLFVRYLYIVLYQIQAIILYVRFQKMQERNIGSQKKNIMPHVCGRKSFSRKRNDIVSNVKLVYYIDINYFTILILYIFYACYKDNQNWKTTMSSRVFYRHSHKT